MRLNDIDFGPCLDASGLRGFSGEGYWFHRLSPRYFDFKGSTTVSKTATLKFNEGNMPIGGHEKNYAPREWLPRCIWRSYWAGIALNAVRLSNPGFSELIDHGLFSNRSKPFMISLMPVADTEGERHAEFKAAVELLDGVLKMHPHLRRILGLQINVTCPNTGHDTTIVSREARSYLSVAYRLDIPLVVKLNLLAPLDSINDIASHPGCAAICCTNAIPFGAVLPKYLGQQITWEDSFPKGSPLAQFPGGGGLSGKFLLPLVEEWIGAVRKAGITIPLNAGGGILHPRDVDRLVKAGLRRGIDSIFIGSIAMLRPWNIRPVIKRAHELLA